MCLVSFVLIVLMHSWVCGLCGSRMYRPVDWPYIRGSRLVTGGCWKLASGVGPRLARTARGFSHRVRQGGDGALLVALLAEVYGSSVPQMKREEGRFDFGFL